MFWDWDIVTTHPPPLCLPFPSSQVTKDSLAKEADMQDRLMEAHGRFAETSKKLKAAESSCRKLEFELQQARVSTASLSPLQKQHYCVYDVEQCWREYHVALFVGLLSLGSHVRRTWEQGYVLKVGVGVRRTLPVASGRNLLHNITTTTLNLQWTPS